MHNSVRVASHPRRQLPRRHSIKRHPRSNHLRRSSTTVPETAPQLTPTYDAYSDHITPPIVPPRHIPLKISPLDHRKAFDRGAFIAIEGLDRSGKSGQTRELARHLDANGIPTSHFQFPNRTTPTGAIINMFLTNQIELSPLEVHNLYLENRYESMQLIRNLLSDGCVVLTDRYSYSGAAFSAAKGAVFDAPAPSPLMTVKQIEAIERMPKTKAQMDLSWCLNSEAGLLSPDAVIYLDISREEQQRRSGFGIERFEQLDFQDSVRDKFRDIMRISPQWGENYIATTEREFSARFAIPGLTATQTAEMMKQRAAGASVEEKENKLSSIKKPRRAVFSEPHGIIVSDRLKPSAVLTPHVAPWHVIDAHQTPLQITDQAIDVIQDVIQLSRQLNLFSLPVGSEYNWNALPEYRTKS